MIFFQVGRHLSHHGERQVGPRSQSGGLFNLTTHSWRGMRIKEFFESQLKLLKCLKSFIDEGHTNMVFEILNWYLLVEFKSASYDLLLCNFVCFVICVIFCRFRFSSSLQVDKAKRRSTKIQTSKCQFKITQTRMRGLFCT